MQREGEGSGTPHSGSVARSRQGGGHTRIEDLEERIGHVVFRSISEVRSGAVSLSIRCLRSSRREIGAHSGLCRLEPARLAFMGSR